MKNLINDLININVDEHIFTEDTLNDLLAFVVFCNDKGKSNKRVI